MAAIQFIRGVDEETVPEVYLTRSRDATNGTARFRFEQPRVLERSETNLGEITGMYLVDEEGELVTRDVQAKFRNGKPHAIEARYIMRSPEEWDRFMRFMERYARQMGLEFSKA
ncbi:MAG: photosystem II reaction center protein Psb28 [Gloeomargarita sp. SKYG116]|nr:photosystem II reaction center protein Psb28 [Gloeomargarita sp. SKYG116]MCS7226188.1 photosystem II reaction center protein Psb28 [Gloeomargarita sp. SKYB31]MDW8400236.1 photosystem II reaction center protein Psb28 [Gloeomargarita sp. SKYGB_i_bin116]